MSRTEKYRYFATPGSGDEPDVIASAGPRHANTAVPLDMMPGSAFPPEELGLRLLGDAKDYRHVEGPMVASGPSDLGRQMKRLLPQMRRATTHIWHEGGRRKDVTYFPQLGLDVWWDRGFWGMGDAARALRTECLPVVPSHFVESRDPYALSVEKMDLDWVDANKECLWDLALRTVTHLRNLTALMDDFLV